MTDMNAQAIISGDNSRAMVPNSQSLPALPVHSARPMEEHLAWPIIARLPVMLAVSIPLSGFRVSGLLGLRCGQIVVSAWKSSEDVPLKVGLLQIGWGEFEVVEQRMALRLTRLA
jgi:hypothetical protein